MILNKRTFEILKEIDYESLVYIMNNKQDIIDFIELMQYYPSLLKNNKVLNELADLNLYELDGFDILTEKEYQELVKNIKSAIKRKDIKFITEYISSKICQSFEYYVAVKISDDKYKIFSEKELHKMQRLYLQMEKILDYDDALTIEMQERTELKRLQEKYKK